METKTLDELKLMAAKKLPEQLRIVDHAHESSQCGFNVVHWAAIESGDEVKETDWYYIVHLLEEKMNEKEATWYLNELAFATYSQKLTAMHNSGFLKD